MFGCNTHLLKHIKQAILAWSFRQNIILGCYPVFAAISARGEFIVSSNQHSFHHLCFSEYLWVNELIQMLELTRYWLCPCPPAALCRKMGVGAKIGWQGPVSSRTNNVQPRVVLQYIPIIRQHTPVSGQWWQPRSDCSWSQTLWTWTGRCGLRSEQVPSSNSAAPFS